MTKRNIMEEAWEKFGFEKGLKGINPSSHECFAKSRTIAESFRKGYEKGQAAKLLRLQEK